MRNEEAETRCNGIGFDSQIIGSNGNSDYNTPEHRPDAMAAHAIDADSIRAEAEAMLAASGDSEQKSGGPQIGYTFGELQQLELPKRDEIVRGLARRETGLLNAVTNIGKTTLIRNLALSLIAGRAFSPLTIGIQSRRVAIIDSEDTLTFLRSDLNNMLAGFSDAEKNLINNHLLLICDARIEDEDLMINKSEHFNILTARLIDFEPDIIFVDTISRCFVIHNENDNSEVKERVMKRLSHLAKRTNAAVFAAHHIGKAKLEEGSSREGSHRGRGASSFGDQSRVILNLERDTVNDSVILSCPKLKGNGFRDQILRLNTETRWFETIGENRLQTSYELVTEMFDDGKVYKTAEVVDEFDGVIAQRTVKRLLTEGVNHGNLQKIRQGHYQKAGPQFLEEEVCANRIGNGTLALSQILMLTLEKYAGPGTRHTCPACGARKSFTRYIDTETGRHLADHAGRCNRESNCGYHFKPRDYFADNPTANGDGWKPGIRWQGPTRKNGSQPIYTAQKTAARPNYIDKGHLIASLTNYEQNVFVKFLLELFPFDAGDVWQAVSDYLIGTGPGGEAIFWQIDQRQRIRTGKLIAYDQQTGKRRKDRSPNWIHATMKKAGQLPDTFELEQCYFGEHLLLKYPGRPIAFVESEKSAVIGSICKRVFPDLVWIACGGKSNFKAESVERFGRDRTILIFPDADGFEKWQLIASDASKSGLAVKVSDLIERRATDAEKAKGYDLADYLIDRQTRRNDPELRRQFTEMIEERLAIMTIDGGLSEDEAERQLEASGFIEYAESRVLGSASSS